MGRLMVMMRLRILMLQRTRCWTANAGCDDGDGDATDDSR